MLRNSRNGKFGRFANCNWRISASSAKSVVPTTELADVLIFVISSVATDDLVCQGTVPEVNPKVWTVKQSKLSASAYTELATCH